MNQRRHSILGTILLVAALFVAAAVASPAMAQTFQSYRCADGTQFIVGFFEYDKRAHLQIDGKAVTLARRFGLSGARYSGGGITLKITKTGTMVKHAGRPLTPCAAI
jgi:membrane-bound inhibitor of C-type lysozyme